ncbi:MAG TPA: CYTH domain-containing protein [Candidatus Saccharimonadia bacterium]|nr:CYTH domain-containing protein [Candidatus Saccharimonadia bacterium]
MPTEEYEVKFLNIDPAAIERRVLELGGAQVFDRVFRRAVFDYADLRLDEQGAWVRVRDEGDKVTFSYKQRLGYQKGADINQNDQGMLEEEVAVSDFETVCAMLRHIGLVDKFYQENRRVQYRLDGVEIDVDYWPQLPPYVEIEAESWAKVDETIGRLGLDPADKKLFSTTQVYAQAGIRDKDYRIMTFDRMVKRDE